MLKIAFIEASAASCRHTDRKIILYVVYWHKRSLTRTLHRNREENKGT
jgi:hypothetical protein